MTTVLTSTTEQAEGTTSTFNALMEQISQDFEELSWLRSLTQRIEHCDVCTDTASVAGELLPQLRELVGAETLLLIESAQNASDAGESVLASECSLRVSHCSGESRHAAEFAYDVVTSFAERAQSRPLVLNDLDRQEQHSSANGQVRSLILLPLARHDHRFGWLLAVNRRAGSRQSDDAGTPLPGLDEFGTVEVGMLQSAAVLLTTHAHNAALFREKEELLVGTIKSLVRTLEARDAYTRGHSDRVAAVARIIAREVGYSNERVERLHLTGLLHDIGKIRCSTSQAGSTMVNSPPSSSIQKSGTRSCVRFRLWTTSCPACCTITSALTEPAIRTGCAETKFRSTREFSPSPTRSTR
jgi:HD-GYP domain-containing protein (c-di-GMP phosphodiesterase class II)